MRRFKNLKGLATSKQKELMESFGIKYHKNCTKQQAHDLISDKGIKRVARRISGNRDLQGRLHGPQPQIGTGEVLYRHGVLEYLDDGNGNVWDSSMDNGYEYGGPDEDY